MPSASQTLVFACVHPCLSVSPDRYERQPSPSLAPLASLADHSRFFFPPELRLCGVHCLPGSRVRDGSTLSLQWCPLSLLTFIMVVSTCVQRPWSASSHGRRLIFRLKERKRCRFKRPLLILAAALSMLSKSIFLLSSFFCSRVAMLRQGSWQPSRSWMSPG